MVEQRNAILIETKTRRDWVQLCKTEKCEFFVMWGDWQGRDIWKWTEFPCENEKEADKLFAKLAASALKYKNSRGSLTFDQFLLYQAYDKKPIRGA